MINFQKFGSRGKTLVFLHGWGGNWRLWLPIIERLKNKFTIYALDLPGFGLSPLSKPYTLSSYTHDLIDFLNKEKIKLPVIIGHSFGGSVAIKFAVNNSEKISGLVLVDSSGIRQQNLRLKTKILLASLGKKLILSSPLAKFFPRLRPLYYRLFELTKSDYFGALGNKNLRETLSLVLKENLYIDFPKIKTPTLIIWGEKDPEDLTPIKFAKIIQEKIKGSKLIVFPNAGHFSFLDEQEKFCQELSKFIDHL